MRASQLFFGVYFEVGKQAFAVGGVITVLGKLFQATEQRLFPGLGQALQLFVNVFRSDGFQHLGELFLQFHPLVEFSEETSGKDNGAEEEQE